MENYQHDFIELAIRHDVLCFGEFTLKSGRVSPYFFNAGKFNSGQALSAVGRCYATAIINSGIAFDVIFGPAYKGIPLASAVTIALAEQHQRDVPYCFNRKEQKDHGEGGLLIGAPLAGKRILIVDDVITAGTAIREVITLLDKQGATAAGVVIGLDRQERGNGEKSAVQEVRQQFGIPVISVITLGSIVNYLSQQESGHRIVARIKNYQQHYSSTGV
jgi:orotate phosphoribosyltransferase